MKPLIKELFAGFAVLCAYLALGIIVLICVETTAGRRFHHYCSYPGKDALLAAEADNVKSCEDIELNGEKYSIVNMGNFGLFPSGAGYLVFDSDGKLADKTRDAGDDTRFQRKWRIYQQHENLDRN